MAPSVSDLLALFAPAIASGILMALLCGFIGNFLVMRKASLLADTLAHSSLAGVGLGFAFGISPGFTVFPTSLGLALGMAWLHLHRRESLNSLTAVIFSVFVGAGILLMTRYGSGGAEIVHVLFGDLIWIGREDLLLLLVLGIPLAALFYRGRRALILTALSRDLAQGAVKSPARVEYLAIVGFALTIALCLKLVGVMLVTALLTIPALIAARLAPSMKAQLLLSPLIAGACTIAGMAVSLWMDLPTGACVAVACGLAFTVASLTVRSE